MKRAWTVLKRAAQESIDDRVLTYAAAIAFYTALSLPPILVIMLWFLGGLSDDAADHLRLEADRLVGPAGEQVIDSVLENADERIDLGGLSGWISSLALLFAATGVFSRLQLALNRVWDVESKPGVGAWGWLRKRLLSIGLLGVVAFLMLVSLAASTFVGALDVGLDGELAALAFNTVATVAVFTVLFAAVFRLLPDVELRWRDAWGGAALTAVLFAAGKWLIGAYLSRRGLGSQYGVAGSAIVTLAWVYFSAAIVLVGAELTQAWLAESGRRPPPNKHAVRVGADGGGAGAGASEDRGASADRAS